MFHWHSRTRNQFVVLPPVGLRVPRVFRKIEFDDNRHSQLLAAMQRLRGKTYLEDGAIRPQDLTPDGRHQTAADQNAWHVISLNAEGKVGACLRYLDERDSSGFNGLWVSHAAIACCPSLGWKMRRAVEFKMQCARAMRIGFGSVGGWAAAREERRTMEPVAIILATYALLELLGGCIGLATATFRNRSSAILRKIGLNPLSWNGAELPAYFDPQYGCEMEVLEFDSAYPNPKYADDVDRLREQLSLSPVICRGAVSPAAESEAPAEFALRMAAVA